MEIWNYGDMELWIYGSMEIWRYGIREEFVLRKCKCC